MQLRPLYSKIQLPDAPPDAIRLLKIHSVEGDHIICHLDQVRLSDAPEYSTLSYTWRSPLGRETAAVSQSPLHHIHFTDGESIPILDNLFQALLRLGKSELHNQHFWIDAVCIDQENTTERSHQVDLMAEIYRNAKHVVVWLGPDDEHAEEAVKVIRCLPGVLVNMDDQDWSRHIDPYNIEDTTIEALRREGLHQRKCWVSLAHFFRRSWWSRAWVIQEVLLAKDIKVFCGNTHELSWSDLELVSHFLTMSSWRQVFSDPAFLGIESGHPMPDYRSPTFLKAAKRDLGIDNDFLYTLIRARLHQCQLPIDKVFSLYGIASASAKEGASVPKANYNLEPRQAFIDTATYILQTSKDMHILAHVEGSRFQRLPDLPSWVPDWTVTEPIGLGITGYKRYWATGDPFRCGQVPEFPQRHILRLKAARIDRITACSESRSETPTGKGLPNWLSVLEGLNATYFTGESSVEAFWRTLLVDTDNHKVCPCPAELGECFQAWLKKHQLYDRFQQICQAKGHSIDSDEKDGSSQAADRFDLCLSHRSCLRLFRTEEGFVGQGSESMQTGDTIWLVPGSRVPLIMRERALSDSQQRCELVGGAYLHGFMHPDPAVLPSGKADGKVGSITLRYDMIEIE